MPDEMRTSLWDHLEELRKVLFQSILALAITTTLSFFVSDFILRWLISPYRRAASWMHLADASPTLMTLYPSEAFMMSFRIALIGGVILALPVLLAQIWGFVSPALKPQEKGAILPALYAGTGLFLVGAVFAFYIVVPTALQFFWEYGKNMGVQTAWTLSHYLSFVLLFLLAFGLVFELPLVIILLVLFDVITPKSLAEKRPYIVVAIFIVAAVLTPPDVMSQLMLAGPMWLLFEGSLLVSRIWIRKEKKGEV